ncbi:MAG: hypothetical protein GY720_18080 [bacterium]|nr:hypothetical protein [bacterium]
MSSRSANRRDYRVSDEAGRDILRKIAAMDPFAGCDRAEVEERLRNMTYGSTHNRISALRRSSTAG